MLDNDVTIDGLFFSGSGRNGVNAGDKTRM